MTTIQLHVSGTVRGSFTRKCAGEIRVDPLFRSATNYAFFDEERERFDENTRDYCGFSLHLLQRALCGYASVAVGLLIIKRDHIITLSNVIGRALGSRGDALSTDNCVRIGMAVRRIVCSVLEVGDIGDLHADFGKTLGTISAENMMAGATVGDFFRARHDMTPDSRFWNGLILFAKKIVDAVQRSRPSSPPYEFQLKFYREVSLMILHACAGCNDGRKASPKHHFSRESLEDLVLRLRKRLARPPHQIKTLTGSNDIPEWCFAVSDYTK
jgi:hypothetical protein